MTITKEKLAGAIANIDELIQKKKEAIGLLEEMRDIFTIAHAIDVNPKDIIQAGYRAPSRGEWQKWSDEAKARLPYEGFRHRHRAVDYQSRVKNWYRLKSDPDRHVFLQEPIFLAGAPQAPVIKQVTDAWGHPITVKE